MNKLIEENGGSFAYEKELIYLNEKTTEVIYRLTLNEYIFNENQEI